jgi:ApaG protein
MYMAVTHQVQVTVEPEFEPDRSDPDERHYFWRYDVEIANLGDRPVTLIERYWRITDADGRSQEVRGPGVVGEQPTIQPGEAYRYASGCPLSTPSGVMVGEYFMVGADGQRFSVAIPAFSLDSPHGGKRVLH